MLERPFYQSTVAFLAVLALVGSVVILIADHHSPGIRIIPAPTPTPFVAVQPTVATETSGLLNINTATAEEMAAALPGIGPVLSARIVAYRNEHGPFGQTDQLMDVSGIGQTTFEKLRDLVTVGE